MRRDNRAGTPSPRPTPDRRAPRREQTDRVCLGSPCAYDSISNPEPRTENRELLSLPHVVIIGGGFAGLHAARALDGAAARVTLFDRHNYHLFQPLLYQVATASLSPGDVASPIRWILRHQKNVQVLLADAREIDPI